jgi:hypothetical protein
LTWIVAVQVVLFWHPFAVAMAIVRAHPETNLYSYLSSAAPPFPGARVLVVGPPLVLLAVWWKMRGPNSASDPHALLRYGIALVFLFYAFAKLMGAQFTILDSQLDKPIREVSGFWLTWYYFGYSSVYGGFVALSQIIGALLLTFRRTTLLGACLLFGITSNIVLIDLCYGVDLGGTFMAVVLWCALAGILVGYRQMLLTVFWAASPSQRTRSGLRTAAAWGLRVGMLAFAASATYWVANVNNRVPTPLDGTWAVQQAQGSVSDSGLPSRIYFEHNRAYMVVFRYPDHWATHHFEIDPTKHTIQIWQTWLQKGPLLFRGAYLLKGDRLELSGRYGSSHEQLTLPLVRIAPAHE